MREEVKVSYNYAVEYLLFGFHQDVFNVAEQNLSFKNEGFEEFSKEIRRTLYAYRYNRAAAGLILSYALACRLSETNWVLQNQDEFLDQSHFFCKKQKMYRNLQFDEGQKEIFYTFFSNFYSRLYFSRNEMSRFSKKYFSGLRMVLGCEHHQGSHAFRHLAVSTLLNCEQIKEKDVANWVFWSNKEMLNVYAATLHNYNIAKLIK